MGIKPWPAVSSKFPPFFLSFFLSFFLFNGTKPKDFKHPLGQLGGEGNSLNPTSMDMDRVKTLSNKEKTSQVQFCTFVVVVLVPVLVPVLVLVKVLVVVLVLIVLVVIPAA